MKPTKVYLAGPLFGIADRHHNLLLGRELKKRGYLVVLPQNEALKHYHGGRFDLKNVSKNCMKLSMTSDCVVANVDGAEADAGTAVEIGIALSTAAVRHKRKPVVVCVRTDVRTGIDREVGMNGMLQLADSIIYKPAKAGTLKEVADFYSTLAAEIDASIKNSLAIRSRVI